MFKRNKRGYGKKSKNTIISRKSGQKIPKIANLQYYKSKANYGTKKKGIPDKFKIDAVREALY